MAPFPNKSGDDKIFFMPSSWVWKFPHSYPLIHFISGHLWGKDWAPTFLLCVINIPLAIKNFQPWSKFLYGQRRPVGETLMYSNLKGRVGKGRQFLLTFYPQRAGSVCRVFRVLCECGLYTDWNELKDNIGSSNKKKKKAYSGISAISTMLLGMKLSLGHYYFSCIGQWAWNCRYSLAGAENSLNTWKR